MCIIWYKITSFEQRNIIFKGKICSICLVQVTNEMKTELKIRVFSHCFTRNCNDNTEHNLLTAAPPRVSEVGEYISMARERLPPLPGYSKNH